MGRKIKNLIIVVVTAVVLAFIINTFILINVIVPTRSMEPTIAVDDRLFALRLSYVFDEPERGDIVVFNSNSEDKLLVKRIIGLPGETVQVINGEILIDGVAIEDYTKIVTKDKENMDTVFVVPDGHYFMMGDNRNVSKDSRLWDEPYISEDEIIGKIFYKYYPRRKFL